MSEEPTLDWLAKELVAARYGTHSHWDVMDPGERFQWRHQTAKIVQNRFQEIKRLNEEVKRLEKEIARLQRKRWTVRLREWLVLKIRP